MAREFLRPAHALPRQLLTQHFATFGPQISLHFTAFGPLAFRHIWPHSAPPHTVPTFGRIWLNLAPSHLAALGDEARHLGPVVGPRLHVLHFPGAGEGSRGGRGWVGARSDPPSQTEGLGN